MFLSQLFWSLFKNRFKITDEINFYLFKKTSLLLTFLESKSLSLHDLFYFYVSKKAYFIKS